MSYLSQSEILELRADLDDVVRVKKFLQRESQASRYTEGFLIELDQLKMKLDQLEMIA